MTWLADALRKWGLPTAEVDGWKTRGADTMKPQGIVCHHDAFRSTLPADRALGMLVHGRPDLPGPLCQIWIDDDNDHTAVTGDPVVYVVAAGRANHAGPGGARGLSGNSTVIGIEARNRGDGEPWSDAMALTYMRTCAALLDHLGRDSSWVFAHREWAPRRKIDPTGIDMPRFRMGVQNILRDQRPSSDVHVDLDEAARQLQDLRRAIDEAKRHVFGPPSLGYENDRAALSIFQTLARRQLGRPDVTGVWDDATAKVAIDIQRFFGFSEYGLIGPQTWAKVDR